jgi:hypothetical protein
MVLDGGRSWRSGDVRAGDGSEAPDVANGSDGTGHDGVEAYDAKSKRVARFGKPVSDHA